MVRCALGPQTNSGGYWMLGEHPLVVGETVAAVELKVGIFSVVTFLMVEV